MTNEELAERIAAFAEDATPADEQSMLQGRWIERRAADGQKYSIAEFEHEADQDLYHLLRQNVPAIVAALRELAAAGGGEVTYEVSVGGRDKAGVTSRMVVHETADREYAVDMAGRYPQFDARVVEVTRRPVAVKEGTR